MEMNIIIFACITILSLALLIISIISYWKYKNSKLIFIGLIFFFFFIRGILLSISLFNDQIKEVISSTYIWLFDLMILVVLYLTSLKR